MPEKYVLRQYQALPLNTKVSMTKARIREWYEHWNGDVFVSFSGGKDSTVLGYLVNDMYPHIPLVFCNTGLEFPEIRQFAEKKNAVVIRPQMRFDEVISTYGYPLISKETSEAIEGFALTEEGNLILMDECGGIAYCPSDRFEIMWLEDCKDGYE